MAMSIKFEENITRILLIRHDLFKWPLALKTAAKKSVRSRTRRCASPFKTSLSLRKIPPKRFFVVV